MKLFHIIITAMGSLLFLVFLFPVLSKRIVNIGNITGLAVSLLIIWFGVRAAQWKEWIQKIWSSSLLGKAGITAAVGIVCLIVGIVVVESIAMYQAAYRTAPEDATVVVLGCKVNGDRPSLALQERIDAAALYLKKHPKAKAVLSGGKGADEGISEAECMERELIKRGIAKERLYQENQSTSTKENLKFSEKVIQSNHLNETIVLITSEFHAYRATQIAKAQGITYGTYSAHTAWWLFPTYYVRELYGVLWQWIKN